MDVAAEILGDISSSLLTQVRTEGEVYAEDSSHEEHFKSQQDWQN
jgi:hypothetical protein